jgi:glutathione S-transferase
MITLYDFELSANCYKVRLMLALLGLRYQPRIVEIFPGQENRAPWFLALNPLGQLPVIEDDGIVLRESQAILAYLASRYDPSGQWYPREGPALLGELHRWLAFAEALTATAGAARAHDSMGKPCDIAASRAGAHRLFRALDEHLWFAEREQQDWLCLAPHPTIADIACFPYTVLSEEGGISRQDYPAIRRWTDRVKRIPGFIPMSGVFPAA